MISTVVAPEPGWYVGTVHAYLDHRVAYCGPDAELIDAIDTFLGAVADIDEGGDAAGTDRGGEPSIHFSVVTECDGRIAMHDDSIIHFSSIDQMLWQLPSELNLFIARTNTMPVLHAGAVRTPEGRVVVVTGPIDAGKSTLIAALIAAGCDYASDESIGIDGSDLAAWGYPKPLTLSPESQRLVGLDPPEHLPGPGEHRRASDIRAGARMVGGRVGLVDLVIHTVYDPNVRPGVECLDPPDAARTLLTNCLNPVRTGQRGLDAFGRLARCTPVLRITHGDSVALARTIVDAACDPSALVQTLITGMERSDKEG